jgi:hemoglobin-like flavoprotein
MNDTRLIQQSFELIQEFPDAVAMLFYGRLFEVDPSVRPMFKSDIRTQGKKLMDTLSAVCAAADRLEELRPQLRSLGKLHAGFGVQPRHYETVRNALLWAFAQALESNFDSDTKAAWDRFLRTASEEMIAGATTEPAQPALANP